MYGHDKPDVVVDARDSTFARARVNLARMQYQAHGSPYGPGDAGLARWEQEQAAKDAQRPSALVDGPAPNNEPTKESLRRKIANPQGDPRRVAPAPAQRDRKE